MSSRSDFRNLLQSPQGAPGSMPANMQPMQQQQMPPNQMGLLQPYAGQFLPAYPGANQLDARQAFRNLATGRAQQATQNYLATFPQPTAGSFMPMQPSYGGLNDYIMRMRAGMGAQPQGSYAPPYVPQRPMVPPNSPYMGGPPRSF